MEMIQYLIIIFAIFAYSWSILRFKDKNITRSEFGFWTIIWSSIIIFTLIPSITTVFSQPLGIGRGIDFIIYFSIIILFYLIFRIYVKIERQRQEITLIVREVAKQEARKRKQ